MPRGRLVTEDQQQRYWVLRARGWSQHRAAVESGFSDSFAKKLERNGRVNGQDSALARLELKVPEQAVPLNGISAVAREALEDRSGVLFVRRYMGIELSRFQQEVWLQLEDSWDEPDRSYVCLNAAPGLGKTTTFTGFAAKRTVLDRAIRGLFISRASTLAVRNVARLRRLLERTAPAVGAASTLCVDFGRFRPRTGDVWKRDEFVVEQFDGSPIEEKEPTWSAFGFDSEWLGNRLDLVFGDDLDSGRTIRNMEIVLSNRETFDNELEPRLEPGGLFVIGQQRLGPFDFSNHVLSKRVLPDDDGSGTTPDGELMYRQVTYKAHYEDLCRGAETHKTGAPAWPDGCLLDPNRLSWRDLRKVMVNKDKFAVVYQQQDISTADALVQRIWVDGGRDPDGKTFIGCWDKDRDIWQLPQHPEGGHSLYGDVLGIITVDPSPTRFWSVQAWAVHPSSEQRFLLDMHRARMEAPDFLDYSDTLGCFTGLVEDWWHNYQKLGVQLSHVIVEINAAQRFMLQYDFFHRWIRTRSVSIISHSTQRNKADPDFGIQMIAPRWMHGQVRLPGKGKGRTASIPLVDEVLRYPHSITDDCVHGQWFLEHNLDKIWTPAEDFGVARWRPSWLQRTG